MEFRHLGSSGLQVSALSLGSWITYGEQVEFDIAFECMAAAFSAGINFFDTAEQYSQGMAEINLGKIIKKANWKRSDLVISTKLFWGGKGPNDKGLSRKHIIEGISASLNRLQLDYVDLLFCHRPDPRTPIEETVRAMNHVINQGKALYWGTSEWSADQIKSAWHIARHELLIPPQMEQPEYNMFNRHRVEKEYCQLYSEIGLGTTTYSPLAYGLLTGKYNDEIPTGTRATLPSFKWILEEFESESTRNNIFKVKKLTPIADQLNCSMAQLALAWCLKNQNVSSVITGASKPGQVIENIEAVNIVGKLDGQVMQEIDEILANKPETDPDFRNE